MKAAISGRTLKALKEPFTFALKHTKDETDSIEIEFQILH